MSHKFRAAVVASISGVLALSACSSVSDAGDAKTVNLVGFAVPEAANDAAFDVFAGTDAGDGATLSGSYGPSGDQSRKVVDSGGRDVDYVHFSLEPDVTRLVDAGLVAEDWNAGANKGVVTTSVAAIAVEEGNPLEIDDWDDLTADDVDIVTPDPASSGSAKWNVLALYTWAIDNGATEAQADEFLTKVFANVVTWAASGREATEAFKNGVGNVLLTYENEAILARQQGQELDYVVPDHTFLIENPGAVLAGADPVATSWLEFVLSDEGQAEYVELGFRPLDGVDISGLEVEGANDPSDPFPAPEKLATVADLGGWSAINDEWFGKDGVKLRFDKLYAEATK